MHKDNTASGDELNIENIGVGYKILANDPTNSSLTLKCEILSKKILDGIQLYYVHYVGLNKRYDRWIKAEELILKPGSVEIPKKKKKEKKEDSKEKTPELESARESEEETKIKNVETIIIREFSANAWYYSPYPREVTKNGTIYLCEFCLYYFSSQELLNSHSKVCNLRHPPGIQIYNDGELSFFELDGYVQKNYCRNLALLSKLFLDHKSLYYDIDVFMFYVLCRRDENGHQIVGYFSKEKISEQGNNLACILTLPFEQRKGYGKILIDFSYFLSKIDGKISGPEKPLSDLGLLSYRAYWLEVILEEIREKRDIGIKELSLKTHITEEDIIGTLISNRMIKYYGDGLIILIDENMEKKMQRNRSKKIDPSCMLIDY